MGTNCWPRTQLPQRPGLAVAALDRGLRRGCGPPSQSRRQGAGGRDPRRWPGRGVPQARPRPGVRGGAAGRPSHPARRTPRRRGRCRHRRGHGRAGSRGPRGDPPPARHPVPARAAHGRRAGTGGARPGLRLLAGRALPSPRRSRPSSSTACSRSTSCCGDGRTRGARHTGCAGTRWRAPTSSCRRSAPRTSWQAGARPLTALHAGFYVALSRLPASFLPEVVGVHYVFHALGVDDLLFGTPPPLGEPDLREVLAAYLDLAGPDERRRLFAAIRLTLALEREHVGLLAELAAWHGGRSLKSKVAEIVARHAPLAGRQPAAYASAGVRSPRPSPTPAWTSRPSSPSSHIAAGTRRALAVHRGDQVRRADVRHLRRA